MAIKKQVFIMSVIFNDEETYGESAVEAISHRLFNEDGVIEWDFRIKHESTLSVDIDDADLEECCLNCGSPTERDDSFCSDICKRSYKG
jgi:hypothetical protein